MAYRTINIFSILAADFELNFSSVKLALSTLFFTLVSVHFCCGQKTAAEYLNLGLSRYYDTDYENAIVNYTKAIELKPDFSSAYYFRAKAKEKLLQFKPAIDDLTEAVKIKADFGEAYFHRGNLYEKINKKTEACKDWTTASQHGYYEASYVVKQKCLPKKSKFDSDDD
jgi:tetratricopeptide (TPR) repeat protein